MKKLRKQVFQGLLAGFLVIGLSSYTGAEETIIQQEKYPSKNAQVITTSQDKLSVVPEITEVSDQKRVAVFSLLTALLQLCATDRGQRYSVYQYELVDF